MNIQTAAIYIKQGYRVRRVNWEPKDYLSGDVYGFTLHYIYINHKWNTESKTFSDVITKGSDDLNALELEDIIADDWELITDNIRKDFNKYHHLEYNDDPDWDNYIPPKGGWFGDDEAGDDDK